MNSAINYEIWAFKTHRTIVRVRLASFLPRKIRESDVAYSSWIWENERSKSGSSHIHDNLEFRYDIQHVFAFYPSVLIPNAKSRGPRFDSAARRARMPYRVLLGRHKEYKKNEIREITLNCEITISSALHRLNRIIHNTVHHEHDIHKRPKWSWTSVLHRYTTDAHQTSNPKCDATAFRHLTGKERQKRQAHPGRSKSSPTHTFIFPCCDGPESIAKFTSKQSSAGRKYEPPKTTEHVRRRPQSENKIA